MPDARQDIIAVEAAGDLLVRGLNARDISSLTDLLTEATAILAPARRLSKGKACIEFLRNMAMANEGIRMMSTDMDMLTDSVIRDIGTLSMRRNQGVEREAFRYALLWQKIDGVWKLATMSWGREAQAAAGGRGRGGGQTQPATSEM